MAGENLKIIIKGHLDFNSTKNSINKQIQALQSKIDKLKLSVQLDEKVSKTLSDFSKAMERHKNIAQNLNRVMHEEKVITKDANGVIKESIRQHLKDGDVRTKNIKRINEQTKATKQQADETRRLIVETDKLRNKQKQVTKQDGYGNPTGGSVNFGDRFKNTTINYNANNEVTSQKATENIKQQNQALESLRQKLQQLGNEGKITASSLARMTTAINGAQTEREINKIGQALDRVNQRATNNNNLDIFRRQAQLNVQNIQRTHGGFVDNAAIQNYLNSVNALSSRTPNLTQRMRELNIQFREVSANARTAAGATQQAGMSFGEMFSTAMTKFPIWMLSASLFYAPIRAMSDMKDRLVEIDSLMVNIKRVMDMPDFKFTELLNDAVNVSDELSSKLTDVLSIMGDFARMSFKENELIDISSTAQVLQNISDLNATEAVDTLTSAMLNYNIAAKDSLMIADQLNEVDL